MARPAVQGSPLVRDPGRESWTHLASGRPPARCISVHAARKPLLICLASVLLSTGCSSGPSVSNAPVQSGSPATTQRARPEPALACRLPINSPAVAGVAPGGFVTFPGGQFNRDPASLRIRLQAHVPSYDKAIQGWLPVEYRNVGPGGDRYILTDEISLPDPSSFYLVDVKSGSRRLLLSSGASEAPGTWQVIDYATAGVYLGSTGIQPAPGLWLLDPLTGKVRVLDGSHFWSAVAGGVAWGVDTEASGQEVLYRLDLVTMEIRSAYQGTGIGILAADDNGEVLVLIGQGPSAQVIVISGSGKPRAVSLPPGIGRIDSGYLRHPGIWLALRPSGLALYTRAHGITLMSSTLDVFDVAGGCW